MKTYCVSCKKYTTNESSSVRKTKQSRSMLLLNCAKSYFVYYISVYWRKIYARVAFKTVWIYLHCLRTIY